MPVLGLSRRSYFTVPQPKVALRQSRLLQARMRPSTIRAVNWADPLARGLLVLIDPVNGDLISGVRTQFVGTARRGGSRFGHAVCSDDTANDCGYVSLPSTHPLYAVTTTHSAAIILNQRARTDYSNILSVPYRSGSWASPFNSWTIYSNHSQSDVMQWQDGNVSFVRGLAWSAADTMYGVTRNPSSANFYTDGRDVSSFASISGTANDWNTKEPIVFLNSSNSSLPNAGIDGDVSLIAFWNRELSAREMLNFYLDPWRLVL